MATPPLLEVRDLRKTFAGAGLLGARRRVTVLDGVSFRLDRGEALALVGQSGSGKSTIGRAILRLGAPDPLLPTTTTKARSSMARSTP